MYKMSVDEKLGQIITLLEQKNVSKSEKIKEDIIAYMMKNYNIKWIRDDIEQDIYEALLGGITLIIDKYL